MKTAFDLQAYDWAAGRRGGSGGVYGYLDRGIIEREADLLNGSCRAHASGNSEAESAGGGGRDLGRAERSTRAVFAMKKTPAVPFFFWFHRSTFKHVD